MAKQENVQSLIEGVLDRVEDIIESVSALEHKQFDTNEVLARLNQRVDEVERRLNLYSPDTDTTP